MIHVRRSRAYLLGTVICLGTTGCQLRMQRPDTIPIRVIEPELLEPQPPEPATEVTKATNATSIRLLDTQALGHIGRGLLRQQPNGELTEDAVWRWSTAPDRYLDTALRLEAASSPDVRLVDTGRAPTLGVTLLAWDLESGGETRLVGAAEFQVTGIDRVIHTHLVRTSQPISAELPGDLAAAAGHVLRRLASQGLASVTSER